MARRGTSHARPRGRSKGGGAKRSGKSGIAKYAIPALAAGAFLYFVFRSPEAGASEGGGKDSPKPASRVDPGPARPPGPRPPSTWGDLPTAIVQVIDPDPGAQPGVRTRMQPSTTAPLVPLGEGSQAFSAYSGKTVAVLETGHLVGDREWWKIITPGGYEGFASAGQISEVKGGQQPNFRRATARPIPGTTEIVQKANAQGPGGGAGVAGLSAATGLGLGAATGCHPNAFGTGCLEHGDPLHGLSPETIRTLLAMNVPTATRISGVAARGRRR